VVRIAVKHVMISEEKVSIKTNKLFKSKTLITGKYFLSKASHVRKFVRAAVSAK
jgi:hypothetical protein